MFIEAIVIGIVLGFFRGGKLKNLNDIDFRYPVLLIGIMAVEMVLRMYATRVDSGIANFLFDNYMYIHLISYIGVLILLSANAKLKYVGFVQAGYVLNLLPMLFNGGKMPISESALLRVGQGSVIEFLRDGLIPTHTLIDANTRFAQFADTIPMTFPMAKVISIGDIVLSIGLILFIYHNMKPKEVR